MRRRFLTLLLVSACAALAQDSQPPAPVDFSHDIVPILREHCAACHTGEKKKGGFSLNSRADLLAGSENGDMVKIGHSGDSTFIDLLTTDNREEQMPPQDAKQPRVPAEKVALLRRWIDAGAEWQDGFTFKKPAYEPPLRPRRPKLPAITQHRKNPIDRILDAYLAEHQLPRPQPVDDATFARRVHLDLIGLLPKPEELARFLNDPAPDKRARLVDSLLARETDYAEHWLTFWNDLLRNDYGRLGFGPGTGAPITRWLYEALLNNKPYDQFARELIAPPTPESSGFSAGLAWRGTVSASQTREVQFAQSMGQTFLGINMKCASCHDSFIDRWKLTDAYGLAAIYAQQPLKIARCDKETGAVAKAAWLFPELGEISADAPPLMRLHQLASLMTHPENGRFTRTMVNRLWDRLMGRGIVHPVDAMQTEPWSADLLDYLAIRFRDDHFDIKKTLALICTSQAYQSHTVIRQKDDNTGKYVYCGPRAKRMTAEEFMDAVWQLTDSAPETFDAPVLRGRANPDAVARFAFEPIFVTAGTGPGHTIALPTTTPTEDPAAPPNPDCTSDGTPPADPAKSVSSAASVAPPTAAEKRAARAAAPPAKYTLRKAFTLTEAPVKAYGVLSQDKDVQLVVNGRGQNVDKQLIAAHGVTVARFGRAFQQGENEVLLAVDAPPKAGPPGVACHLLLQMRDGTLQTIDTDDTWESTATPLIIKNRVDAARRKAAKWSPVTLAPEAESAPELGAAMVETLAHLTQPTPPVRASLMRSDLLQRSLGRPNREQIVSSRPEELTTLQALDLANGDILGRALAAGAKSLFAHKWDSSEALITHLYRAALSRDPAPGELTSARDLLGEPRTEAGVEDLLWAMCMLPEFQLIR